MHVLVVITKSASEYQFFFKDREKARTFKKTFDEKSGCGGFFPVVDEHGKEGSFDMAIIGAVIIIDLEGKIDLELQTNLMAARGEVRLQNAAKTDPVLNGMKGLALSAGGR